jgi:hypothetical protein
MIMLFKNGNYFCKNCTLEVTEAIHYYWEKPGEAMLKAKRKGMMEITPRFKNPMSYEKLINSIHQKTS